jgi:RimJ/RimL family protein N-acetyltransferase
MTSGIQIRPYQVSDAERLYSAIRESHDALYPWMPWCHPDYAIEETRGWLELQQEQFASGGAYEFAILSASGDFLGAVGLNQVDAANRRANLGYWVRTSASGRGIATTAVGLIRMWGLEHTNLGRFELLIAVGNVASLRVAEKSGADLEGTLRSRIVVRDVVHDAAVFSFVRPQ